MPAEAEYEGRRRPLSYGGMARFLVVLGILAGVVATINWQWSTITGLYQHLSHMELKPQTQASHEMPSAQPKFSGLLPQEQNAGQATGAAAPNGQTAPVVAQRIVFYEEAPTISRADAMSARPSGERRQCRRPLGSSPSLRCARTWKSRNAE